MFSFMDSTVREGREVYVTTSSVDDSNVSFEEDIASYLGLRLDPRTMI